MSRQSARFIRAFWPVSAPAAGGAPPSCRARFFVDDDARELDDAARTARHAHREEARAYEGASEFLELALDVDPRARFEADAALAHPWLARGLPR